MSDHAATAELLAALRTFEHGKIVKAREAAKLVRDGDTIGTSGFVGIGFAENLAVAIEARFLETAKDSPHGVGKPADLTLVYAAGQGDGKDRGLNHFGHPGFVKRIVGGHWGLVPKLQALAVAGQIEAYNLPQGVITHLFRDIAAGKPGHLSRIGLDTFVDPRHGGGKLNKRTTEDLVELMHVGGQEYLFYKAFPIDVALLRGTTADQDGNITMEREALTLEALALAMAARNSGGIVIVQVERIAERGSLSPRQVKIPGVLVDCVVVAEKPEYHMQTFIEQYSAAFAGEIRVPMTTLAPMAMSERKIIARRAALELKPNAVVNLGIGMPEGVADVAAEERISDLMTLTAEPGVIGGIPAGGLNFGAATNAQAIIDQPNQFDFYDGGGLDIAVLGLAQADAQGNLNVSQVRAAPRGRRRLHQHQPERQGGGLLRHLHRRRPGGRGRRTGSCASCRRARRASSCRRSSTAPSRAPTRGGAGSRCSTSPSAACSGSAQNGLELIEIAPGIDLERDVLGQMDFAPLIPAQPRLMDARLFASGPMGLREQLLEIPLDRRLTYDADSNALFINFERLSVRTPQDVEDIRRHVANKLAGIGKKVYAIVNYDNFSLAPELVDDYAAMVKGLLEAYYWDVTRYTTSGFLRMKLGDALERRGVAPHIYESSDEALKHLRDIEVLRDAAPGAV